MNDVRLLYIYGRRYQLLKAAEYLMGDGVAFRYSHRSSQIEVLLRNMSVIRRVQAAMSAMHIHTQIK